MIARPRSQSRSAGTVLLHSILSAPLIPTGALIQAVRPLSRCRPTFFPTATASHRPLLCSRGFARPAALGGGVSVATPFQLQINIGSQILQAAASVAAKLICAWSRACNRYYAAITVFSRRVFGCYRCNHCVIVRLTGRWPLCLPVLYCNICLATGADVPVQKHNRHHHAAQAGRRDDVARDFLQQQPLSTFAQEPTDDRPTDLYPPRRPPPPPPPPLN